MSDHAQSVLIQSLMDAYTLDYCALTGVDPEIIPSESLREVYLFSMKYWERSGRVSAPTEAVLRQQFGDLFDDEEIELVIPEETIEWAIDDLKSDYVKMHGQNFLKSMARDLAEATLDQTVAIIGQGADSLMSMHMKVVDQTSMVDVRRGVEDRYIQYGKQQATYGDSYGFQFGMPLIDSYTSWIHPGELAILAAGPKTGKSYFLAAAALNAWRLGATPVLFTLENSVDLTLNRMACMAAGVDPADWQHHTLDSEAIERVKFVIEEFKSVDHPLLVIQPNLGERSFPQMVRQAQLRGADAVLVDQLTFVEMGSDRNKPKTQQIGEALHTLKAMISTGRDPIPTMVAHQINREGVKAAEKTGHLEMYHLADSAEVERSADFVFGLYQNDPMRVYRQALLQTLAARRVELRDFTMLWDLKQGRIEASRVGRP